MMPYDEGSLQEALYLKSESPARTDCPAASLRTLPAVALRRLLLRRLPFPSFPVAETLETETGDWRSLATAGGEGRPLLPTPSSAKA